MSNPKQIIGGGSYRRMRVWDAARNRYVYALSQPPGYVKLWGWFGLSRAKFCVLPRSMMHEMPDEWQLRMAELLEQWDETWTNWPEPFPMETVVHPKNANGRFAKWPEWLLNYRHPDTATINRIKTKRKRAA